jgi:hypothetical protein
MGARLDLEVCGPHSRSMSGVFLVEQTHEPLQKCPRMEISGEGLTLGARTVLAGMAREPPD